MKYTCEWSRGKPALLALFCSEAVFAAPSCLKLIEMCQGIIRDPWPGERPDRETWLAFYDQPLAAFAMVLTTFGLAGPSADGPMTIENVLNAFSQKDEVEIDRILEKHFELLGQADLVADVPMAAAKAAVVEPATQWYMGVCFPCWILNGVGPDTLLQRAAAADLGALEKLAPLDPRVIHHPSLGAVLHPIDRALEKERLALVDAAIQKGVSGRITLKSVKYVIAGAMSVVGEMMGYELKPKEIRRLFDAVARDVGGERILRDGDLAAGENAFGRAVGRGREVWEHMLLADMNCR